MPEVQQVADLASAVHELARALQPQPHVFSLTDGLALVGAVVALGTFIAGLWQYQRAQALERARFAITAVDQFEANPMVRNATLMLDWTGRRINLWPTEADSAEVNEVIVTHESLARALRTDGDQLFTVHEAGIRDTFDHFFHQLARFERLIQSRLISAYELRPYLAYWCEALAGTKSFKGRVYVDAVQMYMRTYGFQDSLKLVQRFAAE